MTSLKGHWGKICTPYACNEMVSVVDWKSSRGLMACSAENGYENSVNPTRQSSNGIWLQVATVYYHKLHHACLLAQWRPLCLKLYSAMFGVKNS